MNILFISTVFQIVFFSTIFGQVTEIGQWRAHLPFQNVISISEAFGTSFCATDYGLFKYNYWTNELTPITRTTGLSGTDIELIKYNKYNYLLLIAYKDGNIDLLLDESVFNISDLQRKNVTGKKKIYHIHFVEDLAYLSTSFGIIVLDMAKKEIKDTYIIGDNGGEIETYSLTTWEDTLFAMTEQGIKLASLKSPNLNNFSNWKKSEITNGNIQNSNKGILTFDYKVIAFVNDTVFKYENGNWSNYYSDPLWKTQSINGSDKYLLIVEEIPDSNIEKRLHLLNDKGVDSIIQDPSYTRYISEALLRPVDSTIIMSGMSYGMISYQNNTFWNFYPNGPLSIRNHQMKVFNKQLYVAPGTVTSNWTKTFNSDGYYAFNNNYWSSYAWWSLPELNGVFDFLTIEKSPVNNHTFLGSFGEGIVELNENVFVNKYDKSNSSLQADPGDTSRLKISAMEFDREGNLWVANYSAPSPISVLKTDGTWKAFKPNISTPHNKVIDIVIDNSGNKWLLLLNGGLLVFNDQRTIDNTADDEYRILAKGIGNGNLHSLEIFDIEVDRDGEIWVGTQEGIAVFYCPESVFSSSGCDANRIAIDVEGYVGYLLETEKVQAIAIDGANRKWLGTTNGVWLMSADGTKQIQRFTSENSPLLSNNVQCIAIDQETGEVYFGTDKGIISYRSDATQGSSVHENVMVYPNPVREDFTGNIAIKGLVEDASVKITDISGNLVYETTALGGQAIWNGNTLSGKRVQTGIYLVYSTDDDGFETFVSKFVVIN